MAAPPLLAVLLLLASFLPSPTAAARLTNPKPPFPPVTPPHLQAAAHRQQHRHRVRSSLDANNYVTATAAKPFTAHYFPQELDHFTFTPNSSMTFNQKYLLNDTFWRRPGGDGGAGTKQQQAGPLFVYTGNEGDIEWFATNTGFMFDVAPKFSALLVFIEVRACAPCSIRNNSNRHGHSFELFGSLLRR
jgi:lysosomal Pro-X carboxypeptidase